MQPYDIAMIVILVVATGFGFIKGMAWQIASLASLVASYFASLHMSDSIAPMFGNQAPWNKFAAMGTIYVASGIGIWMAFRLVSAAIDRVKLAEFDRQIGAIFGAFKGAIICLAITFFAVSLSTSLRENILHTKSGYAAAWVIHKADPIIPAEMHQMLEPYIHQLDDALPPGSFHAHDTDGQGRAEGGGLPGLPNWGQPQGTQPDDTREARRTRAGTRPLDQWGNVSEDVTRQLGNEVMRRLNGGTTPPPNGTPYPPPPNGTPYPPPGYR